MRPGYLGYYGYGRYTSPNVDAVAVGGGLKTTTLSILPVCPSEVV